MRTTPRARSNDAQALVSQNLKKWRHDHHLLLKEMAPALGVSKATLDAWERGKRFPTGTHLTKLAGYTQMPVCWLFCSGDGDCPCRSK